MVPPVGDALRGPYLRWMVFYAACVRREKLLAKDAELAVAHRTSASTAT